MSNGIGPNVSVVIPCYNQAHFLNECLRSLQAQTLEDWEALVVDDASSRGDPAGVVTCLHDRRISLLRHDVNRGLGASRNTGFMSAACELVLPLDSDDALEPTFLERTVAVLQGNMDIDCVFTDFQTFGASDIVVHYVVPTLCEMRETSGIPGPGTLMRKAVWRSVGGYSEMRALLGDEDWDFWIGAMERGLNARLIPAPLYRYRQHSESMTSGTAMGANNATVRETILKRHPELFRICGGSRVFRAQGYLNSSRAERCRQAYLRAIYMSVRAFLLAPTDRRIARGAIREVSHLALPLWLVRKLRFWANSIARLRRIASR